MKGKSIVASVNPQGETLSWEAEDETVRKLFSEDQLRAMLQHLFVALPPRPVGRGTTWKHLSSYGDTLIGGTRSSMQLDGFEMEIRNASRVRELRRGGKEAVLSTEGEFDVRAKGHGNQFEVRSATTESEALWRVDRGIVESMWSTTEICVSYFLVHVSRLRTRTTVGLMTSEGPAALAPARSLQAAISPDELRGLRRRVIGILDRVAPLAPGSKNEPGARINGGGLEAPEPVDGARRRP